MSKYKVIDRIEKDNYVVNILDQSHEWLKSDQFYEEYAAILIEEAMLDDKNEQKQEMDYKK